MNTNSPINPATGLPMIDDSIGGVDVAGNPFGTDWNMHDSFDHQTKRFRFHSRSFHRGFHRHRDNIRREIRPKIDCGDDVIRQIARLDAEGEGRECFYDLAGTRLRNIAHAVCLNRASNFLARCTQRARRQQRTTAPDKQEVFDDGSGFRKSVHAEFPELILRRARKVSVRTLA